MQIVIVFPYQSLGQFRKNKLINFTLHDGAVWTNIITMVLFRIK